MYKIQEFLASRINIANDEGILSDNFDSYQRALLTMNKISNPKIIDQMLQGAQKYLGFIKEAYMKEIASVDGNAKAKQLTEFITKVTKDI